MCYKLLMVKNLTAQVVFSMEVPLGIVNDGRDLPASIELSCFSLRDTDALLRLAYSQRRAVQKTDIKHLTRYLIDGLNQEVVKQVPLLMCDPLYRDKKVFIKNK